ncbi:hypothetical protein FA15DRAFT_757748 [Coprinopsis marcescibilis]|uniref:F-box domain-containing protein n=1 Tax=Coprinopsis marcescibilis TaxID=230819 RepID=A0A5C3KRL5_COPMA|nr:hypothetical protein FA15DRAFT_757748 [Coprinopsis marcescibilis]
MPGFPKIPFLSSLFKPLGLGTAKFNKNKNKTLSPVFPPEIFSNILIQLDYEAFPGLEENLEEQFAFPSPVKISRQTAFKCSRVSRYFRNHFLRRLFHTITVRSAARLDALTLLLQRNRSLILLVKTLYLAHPLSKTLRQSDCSNLVALLNMLREDQVLENLVINNAGGILYNVFFSNPSVRDALVDLLMNTPSLRGLAVNNINIGLDPNQWVSPSLEYLSVLSVPTIFPKHSKQHNHPHTHKVPKYRLHTVRMDSQIFLLRNLARSQGTSLFPSLTALRLSSASVHTGGHITKAALQLAPNLRTFFIDTSYGSRQDGHELCVLGPIENIAIWHSVYPRDSDDFDSNVTIFECIKAPCKLKTLRLLIMGFTTVKRADWNLWDLERVLSTAYFSELKQIVMDMRMWRLSANDRIAAEKGIQWGLGRVQKAHGTQLLVEW